MKSEDNKKYRTTCYLPRILQFDDKASSVFAFIRQRSLYVFSSYVITARNRVKVKQFQTASNNSKRRRPIDPRNRHFLYGPCSTHHIWNYCLLLFAKFDATRRRDRGTEITFRVKSIFHRFRARYETRVAGRSESVRIDEEKGERIQLRFASQTERG